MTGASGKRPGTPLIGSGNLAGCPRTQPACVGCGAARSEKRPSRNRSTGCAVRPAWIRSARISPTTEQNLNPCPGEAGRHHDPWVGGEAVDHEVLVGEFVNRHVASASVGPAPSGKYRSAKARSTRSSSGWQSRSIASGSTAWPRWW